MSTPIVDIEDTNPQNETFDTVRSIDLDQEGFIDTTTVIFGEENFEDSANKNNDEQDGVDDTDVGNGVEMAPLVAVNKSIDGVDSSLDHGIPSDALREAMHPQQHYHQQLQQLTEEDDNERRSMALSSSD